MCVTCNNPHHQCASHFYEASTRSQTFCKLASHDVSRRALRDRQSISCRGFLFWEYIYHPRIYITYRRRVNGTSSGPGVYDCRPHTHSPHRLHRMSAAVAQCASVSAQKSCAQCADEECDITITKMMVTTRLSVRRCIIACAVAMRALCTGPETGMCLFFPPRRLSVSLVAWDRGSE